MTAPAPASATMRMAVWSWAPQSQYSEPKMSPVRHCECMRTSTGSSEKSRGGSSRPTPP